MEIGKLAGRMLNKDLDEVVLNQLMMSASLAIVFILVAEELFKSTNINNKTIYCENLAGKGFQHNLGESRVVYFSLFS
jgi:hypothetical protein